HEFSLSFGDGTSKSVIYQPRELNGCGRFLDVCPRCGEANHLHVDSVLTHGLFAHVEVTMTGNGNVIVPGIVKTGILVAVVGDVDGARSQLQSFDVFRWIVMIVEINDRHQQLLSVNVDATRQSTREGLEESSPDPARCRGG